MRRLQLRTLTGSLWRMALSINCFKYFVGIYFLNRTAASYLPEQEEQPLHVPRHLPSTASFASLGNSRQSLGMRPMSHFEYAWVSPRVLSSILQCTSRHTRKYLCSNASDVNTEKTLRFGSLKLMPGEAEIMSIYVQPFTKDLPFLLQF